MLVSEMPDAKAATILAFVATGGGGIEAMLAPQTSRPQREYPVAVSDRLCASFAMITLLLSATVAIRFARLACLL
jgi:hypothetical protein